MLSAKINNQWIDMFPGTSIKYVFNSPAFSDSPIVGDFSYTISFPLSDKNKNIFNYVNLPEIFEDVIEYDFELYHDNSCIIVGSFVLKNANEKISGNIINSAFSFINQIKNKTTKDLEMSDITRHSGTPTEIIEASHLSGYPTFHFAHFPVLNETLYDGTAFEGHWHTNPYINYYHSENHYFNINVLFPYLCYVLDCIFDTFNVNLINNLFSDNAELRKLCLISLYREPNTPEHYKLVDSINKVNLEKLLTGINKTFCTCFFFNKRLKKAEMVYLKDLLTGDFDDWTDKVTSYPDKSLEEIYSGFELSFDFDGGDEIISAYQLPEGSLDDAIISDSVSQQTFLPDYGEYMMDYAGEIRLVISDQLYYILVYFDDEKIYKWTPLTWKFFEIKTGDFEKKISSPLSPIGMIDHAKKPDPNDSSSDSSFSGAHSSSYSSSDSSADSSSDIWLTPYINQNIFQKSSPGALSKIRYDDANYNICKTSISDQEARILFYRGKYLNFLNQDYPLGTSSHYNGQGGSIGSLSLTWEGSDGLYENFWKEWLAFLEDAKPLKFGIKLDNIDILNLDLKKRKKIGSNYYLVKKITIDLPIKKSATVEMYRI